jgi:hypothetical protein
MNVKWKTEDGGWIPYLAEGFVGLLALPFFIEKGRGHFYTSRT